MRLKTKPKQGQQQAYPTGVSLNGDEAKAGAWLPWARNKLQTLINQAKGHVRSKVFNPEPDIHVEINVSTNTAFIRIVAGGTVYVDSGFYDHIQLAPLHPDAYLPSRVRYGTEQLGSRMQGRLRLVKGYTEGETLPADRQSIPMGAKKPLIRTAGNGWVSSDPIYADDPMLLRRKRIQNTLKPSNWQGLTRQWIQALYGSIINQGHYDIPTMMDNGFIQPGQTAELSIQYTKQDGSTDWIGIPHTGIQAPWILVQPNQWIYWLVTVNANQTATFRKLSTAIQMGKQADIYSNLQARQAHAALLAGSRLTDTHLTVPLAVAPVGDTNGIGWAADGYGHIAKIVGHALFDADPPKRLARSYSATVLFDEKGKPKGMTLTLDEEAFWDINSGVHCLYFPVEVLGIKYEQAQGKLDWFGGLDCDAPLLARSFAPNYTPQIVRFIGKEAVGPVGFAGAGIAETGTISEAYSTPLPWTVTFNGDVNVAPSSGLGGTGNGIEDDVQEFFWWPETLANSENEDLGHASDSRGDEPPGDGYWEQRVVSLVFQNWLGVYHLEVGVLDMARPLLIVPFADAESLATGLLSGRRFDEMYESRKGPFNFTRSLTLQHRFIPIPGDGTPVAWSLWGTIVYNDADQPGSFNDVNTGKLASMPSSGQITELNGSAYDFSVRVHAKGQVVNVADPSPVYFQPEIGPTGNPLIDPTTILSSMGSPYFYALSQGEGGSSDWPYGAYNPVGWA
jgi:hypothetical protein